MERTIAGVEPERPAPPAPDAPEPARNPPPPRRSALVMLALAAAGAALAATAWIAAAALTAGHGFDVSDEGFYLLSYRWWRTNLQTFTGVQFLYGPVFQLFGYDIAALRVFRLLTIVGTHLAFGWAFMRWLRQRRPNAPGSRLWEVAGVAVIVACGGMVYSWLPLSPGYNDVSLLGALLAAAVVLRIATYVDRGAAVPAWVPAALGPVVVAMLLAKWASSAVTLGLIAIAGVAAITPRGVRGVLRVTAWAAASALLTIALIQVFVVPLTTALPRMLATNKLVAAGANSPRSLLKLYLDSGAELLLDIVKGHAVLLVAAVVAVAARGRVLRVCAAGLAAVGLGITAWRLADGGHLHGGTVNIELFPIGLVLALLVAVLVGAGVLLDRRRPAGSGPTTGGPTTGATGSGPTTDSLRTEGRRGWVILAMLALLPIAQAAGTGNPLHFMAVNAFAAWAAIIIAVFTGIESASPVARWLAAAAAGLAVLLSASVASDGLWNHPYRTDAREHTTAPLRGVPALDGIRLAPRRAEAYSRFHERLKPYIRPTGRAIMAFDEMAGVVLILDGRPVGEAWYSAIDPGRTAAGIRTVCRDGHGWWGSRAPILLFGRPVTQTEIDALGSCGLVFASDYRLLAPAEEMLGLRVYVPTADDANGQR